MVPYLRALMGPSLFYRRAIKYSENRVYLMSCALILHLVSHMKMFPDTVSGHTTDSDVLLVRPLMSAKYLHKAWSAYFSFFYQHHDCSVKTFPVRFLDIISDSLQINQQVESCWILLSFILPQSFLTGEVIMNDYLKNRYKDILIRALRGYCPCYGKNDLLPLLHSLFPSCLENMEILDMLRVCPDWAALTRVQKHTVEKHNQWI